MSSEEKQWDVVILGGGAAGFFAGIACAESNPACRVIILERGRSVLAKVRISGGGRCNVTHACFDPKALARSYPRGGAPLIGAFHRFQPRDTVAWFESRGVALKTEPDGRLFPMSDSSQTIIDCLTGAAAAAGMEVRTNVSIASVQRAGAGFLLWTASGDSIACDRLLLATGGGAQGHAWAKAFGHAIEPPVPSLFTFTVPDERLKGLAGVAVEDAEIAAAGTSLRQTGPLLITHWGFSGPAALRLSAWGARVFHDFDYRARLTVDWLRASPEEIRRRLQIFKEENPRKSIHAHGPFSLPHRLWERLAAHAGVPADRRWADLSRKEGDALIGELTAASFEMTGKSAFKEEFVTCGGVRLDEVDFKTMESRICPGLYFAGEILDVDGITGGFNFQNAWTTGWLAGMAMAGIGKIKI